MARKWTIRIATAVIAATTVGLGLWGWQLALRSVPPMHSVVRATGPAVAVDISRDTILVPHISPKTAEDATFGLGYVHAQDWLWQMEFTRRVGAGRLAEVLGEPALTFDHLLRTVGTYRLAEAREAAASPALRQALEAHAAGVNAFLPNFLPAHYDDMLRRWRDGEYIRIAGSRDDLARAADRLVLAK